VSPNGETSKDLLFELGQIRKELTVLNRMLGKRRRLGRDEVQIRAAASSLQSIYNGMEKMLAMALERQGRKVRSGPTSHSDLLDEARAVGIISLELNNSLRELMGFRHFYRHSYGFLIDNEQMNPLLEDLDEVINALAQELHVESGGA